jgi:hypothetical protein
MQSTSASNNPLGVELLSQSLFIREDGYTLRLEYTEVYIILHLMDITQFTKDVFRRMQRQLLEWSDFIRAMGHTYIWAAVPYDNIKIKRLLGGLQFKFEGQMDGMSVYKYEV